MKKRKWAGRMAAMALVMGSGTASAVPIQWTVEAPNVVGSFTYDADTKTYSDVSLFRDGGGYFRSVTFTVQQSIPAWPDNASFLVTPVNGDWTDVDLLMIEAPAFTNAGGSVSHTVITGECLNDQCSTFDTFKRTVRFVGRTPGSHLAGIPTLSEWGLIGLSSLMALAALVHARRYRSNSGAPRA